MKVSARVCSCSSSKNEYLNQRIPLVRYWNWSYSLVVHEFTDPCTICSIISDKGYHCSILSLTGGVPMSLSSGVESRNRWRSCFVVLEVKHGKAGPHWATSTSVTILSLCFAAALINSWQFHYENELLTWVLWGGATCSTRTNPSPCHSSTQPCPRSAKFEVILAEKRPWLTLNGEVSKPRFFPGELFNINPKSMWMMWPLLSINMLPLWRSLVALFLSHKQKTKSLTLTWRR